MKIMIFVLLVAFSSIGNAFADASSDRKLSIPDSAEGIPSTLSVELHMIGAGTANQELPNFTLKLPACVDCAYTWHLKDHAEDFAKITYAPLESWVISTGYVEKNGRPELLMGGTALETIVFPGLAVGTYDFVLLYKRSWEAGSAQTLTVHVTVLPE